ncbi:MAG: hypothetical protein HC888_00260 [Candidatus Competibacteraceae bacterium]|nr:hypothetical protein [Candidatus Competibacteraceae bacterium]
MRRIIHKQKKFEPKSKATEEPKYVRDKSLYCLPTWKGSLGGLPVFLLGNGCSLLGISDWPSLDPFFTIGMNRIFLRYDPTVLMWQDIELWKEHSKQILELQAIKVARPLADPQGYAIHFHLKGGVPKFTGATNRLQGYGTTGILAAQLAVLSGSGPLVLLGMDCAPGPGGSTDFYGNNRHHKQHTMSNCMRGLWWLKDASPVEIINCSDNGLWPKQPINEVIDRFDKPEYRRSRSYFQDLFKSLKRK